MHPFQWTNRQKSTSGHSRSLSWLALVFVVLARMQLQILLCLVASSVMLPNRNQWSRTTCWTISSIFQTSKMLQWVMRHALLLAMGIWGAQACTGPGTCPTEAPNTTSKDYCYSARIRSTVLQGLPFGGVPTVLALDFMCFLVSHWNLICMSWGEPWASSLGVRDLFGGWWEQLTSLLKGWLCPHVHVGACNSSGLQTRHILADPPCVHRHGLMCASQKF